MPSSSSSISGFRPPHCPNPDCDFHRDSRGWRFKRAGFYRRQAVPRRIQRYRCSRCQRSFSSQTFATSYWLRRPDLLEPVFRAEVAGSGHRQIARPVTRQALLPVLCGLGVGRKGFCGRDIVRGTFCC